MRRFGYIALATALATLLVVCLLFLEEWRRFNTVFVQIAEARRLLTLNRDLIDFVRDAETGQRGYLLTGRIDYLAPYETATQQIPSTMDQLTTLGAQHSEIKDQLQQLRSTVDNKLSELRETIALYRSSGSAAASALVQTNRGKHTMDHIRSLSQEIDRLAYQHWSNSWNELRTETGNIRLVALLGTLLLVVLVGSGGLALQKATHQTHTTLETLRSTLYSIGDGVITTDRSGAVQMMNAVAEQLTGYTEREARGRNIEEIFRIVNEASRAVVENPVRQVIRDKRSVALANHTVLLSKTGVEIPIDDCGAPIAGGDSSQGVVLVFRDVSARRKAAETARRLASIVENSDDAIISKTLDGIVTTWNRGAERLFGFSAEEMIGQPISRIIPPDRPNEVKGILERIANGELVDHYQTERITKDGRRIEVALTVSPIRDHDGQIVGASKVARDITRERQLEGALRQAQKMEAVGRLAGGVAHDFNNLLTVILGYATTLSGRIGSEDPSAKMVAEIRRAAEQASAVTGQLLAFSRKQVTHPRVIDLNQAVPELTDMLQRLIGEDIDLSVKLDQTPCCTKIDPGQLSQVLLNLAVNARDAMPTGGTLTIETRKFLRDQADVGSHGARAAGAFSQLIVTDGGSGMDAETIAHIFEPFFTTKESGKGTGLGLATVYGIVQQHGGWIDVYSELGHGTTFKINLPMVASAPVKTEVAPDGARPRRPATILLVEDQAAIRMLAEDVLIDAGHTVLSAPNGREALQVAAEYKDNIEVLITDVVMPEMSGPEVAAQLSLLRPDLLVLYISGFTDHALLHRGAIEQGTAFLQKPFVPAALLEKVDSLWPQNLSASA